MVIDGFAFEIIFKHHCLKKSLYQPFGCVNWYLVKTNNKNDTGSLSYSEWTNEYIHNVLFSTNQKINFAKPLRQSPRDLHSKPQKKRQMQIY